MPRSNSAALSTAYVVLRVLIVLNWLVGAAFSMQRVERLAAASWDVPMDALCTEQDSFLFRPECPPA